MDSFIGRTVFGLDQKRKEVGNEREGSWKTVGISWEQFLEWKMWW
jgi:hypothetical protein